MPAITIRQNTANNPSQNVQPRVTAAARPNITNKLKFQLAQETILEAEADELTDTEEYTEKEISAEEDDSEQIIEYDSHELDIDDDSELDDDGKEGIFDSTDKVSSNIRPDIVLQEICCDEMQASVSVFIPSKVRSLSKKVSKDHKIRTEALEQIGKLIAEKDKDFLLGDNFAPSLITYKEQKEIAGLIGKDEVWITRLKQSCIVQTPLWGLQPLSLFFPPKKSSYSDAILECISNEKPLEPYSIEQLASLISQGNTKEYQDLISNAGSKLRRILEDLSIPPQRERLKLAKVFAQQLTIEGNENMTPDDLIKLVTESESYQDLSELLNKYSVFCKKLIQRLKNSNSSK